MKERWTIEVEVEVETIDSSWEHMRGPTVDVSECMGLDGSDGLWSAMDDGLHFHAYRTCSGPRVPWRLVKREVL